MPQIRRFAPVAPACLAVLAACGSDPVTALFTVPRDGVAQEFYELPFPNDIRRNENGFVDMSGYPRPVPLVNLYIDACQTLDGFGTNNAIFTRFAAPIDEGRLPVDMQDSVQSYASVYLVDVDAASPGYGHKQPIVFRFQDYAGWTIGANWLGALPAPGFPLREGTTYALVVTTRLDVTSSPDFDAILASSVPADPALARAQEKYAPLLAWLDEPGGDERSDVASAAVFTTQHVTSIMGLLRQRARSLPMPIAREIVQRDAGDNPYTWYDGVFDSPNFQSGELPYNTVGDGDIIKGIDGLPIVQRMEPLRFSFTIPTNMPMPSRGWPVAIYAHGTGGSFHSFVNDETAKALAEVGIAGISIDQVLHPPRSSGNPETTFFNFQNPWAASNNPIQGAADDFSVVRLVESFSMREEGNAARVIRFDPSRIYFFGHSQGGLTGPPFVAYEPAIKGAVLSGAGGTLYNALLHKTEPVDITALISGVIIDQPLDQWNPVLSILQMWVERSDSVNYGPLLVRDPAPGMEPRPIFQTMGFIDHYTPLPTIEAFAVSIGGNLVGPELDPIEGLALMGRSELAPPVSGNLGGTTAVLMQYNAAPSSDGHFVVFDVDAARRQSTQFLSTLASTGTATVPP
jgi:hypothetical protein